MKTKREQYIEIGNEILDSTFQQITKDEGRYYHKDVVEEIIIQFTDRLLSLDNQDIPDDGVVSVPMQLCPKCNGQGTVSKPPYVPGDIHEWISTSTIFPCDVCNGAKIIPQSSLLPEIPEEEIINSIPYPDHISNAQKWKNIGFIRGAKWVIKELKSRIETKQ